MRPPGIQSPAGPVVLFLLLSLCAQELMAAASIQTDQSVATAGYFHLRWYNNSRPELESDFVVQQSRTPGFEQPRILYKGTETASLISGLPNGEYFYRVRQGNEPGWSEPVRVEVHHHSLGAALQFFGLGLLVFALTLLTILHGIRKTRD